MPVMITPMALDPAERAALRAEIEKFRRLPEAERHQLRLGWGALDPDLLIAFQTVKILLLRPFLKKINAAFGTPGAALFF